MFVLGGLRGGSSWRDVGVLGEVLAKTPIFYQVPNWSYGQKTQKRGGKGDPVVGGGGQGGRFELEGCGGSKGRSS